MGMKIEGLEQRRLLSGEVLINFDFDGLGNPTTPGQIIDDEYASVGVTVSTNSAAHPAMIFDSAAPTGGDDDLGSPHQDFGGQGVGAGGAAGTPGENADELGRILILSEDNDPSDPDDDADGGAVTFAFAQDTEVVDVSLLDVDGNETTIVDCFDGSGQLVDSVTAARLGDNSFQTLAINAAGVRRLVITTNGSLGIPGLSVRPPDLHLEGRMTGGGSIFVDGVRVTHGFELHCAEPSELVNNHLEINWGSPNQHFHLLTLTDVECFDTEIIQQPREAPIDTLVGVGNGRYSGKFNGKSYLKAAAAISFTLTDGGPEKGEPGIFDTSDYVITILDANQDGNANDPIVVLNSGGAKLLDKGNHQAHPELKNLTQDALAARSLINNTFAKLDDPRISQAKASAYVEDLLVQFSQFEAANAVPVTTTSTSTVVEEEDSLLA